MKNIKSNVNIESLFKILADLLNFLHTFWTLNKLNAEICQYRKNIRYQHFQPIFPQLQVTLARLKPLLIYTSNPSHLSTPLSQHQVAEAHPKTHKTDAYSPGTTCRRFLTKNSPNKCGTRPCNLFIPNPAYIFTLCIVTRH